MPAAKQKSLINLLPADDFPETLMGRILKWLLTTFRFIVISVELVVIIGFLSRFFLDTQNSDLTDEINQKKALIESYLPFEKDFKRTQAQLAILKSYTKDSLHSAPLVTRVAELIPSQLQLTSFTNHEGLLEIKVTSGSEAAVSSFVSVLSKDSQFSDVYVSQIENRGAETAVVFTIHAVSNIGKENS